LLLSPQPLEPGLTWPTVSGACHTQLHEYLDRTGEVEAVALKHVAIRGIRELRLAEVIRIYLEEVLCKTSARPRE